MGNKKKEEELKNTSVLAVLMKPNDRRQFAEIADKKGTNASNLARIILCNWMSKKEATNDIEANQNISRGN